MSFHVITSLLKTTSTPGIRASLYDLAGKWGHEHSVLTDGNKYPTANISCTESEVSPNPSISLMKCLVKDFSEAQKEKSHASGSPSQIYFSKKKEIFFFFLNFLLHTGLTCSAVLWVYPHSGCWDLSRQGTWIHFVFWTREKFKNEDQK